MKPDARPPWRVALSVWHALLLREAVARLFNRRGAWLWLLLEPAAYIGFMVFVFAVLRARVIGGMDTAVWLASGLLAYFVFRRVAVQGASAIGANLALFTYRQVLPVDTVLVRCALEGVLVTLTAALIAAALAQWDKPTGAQEALVCASAVAGLWLLGVGWALAASVGSELVPELGRLLGLFMMPLMLASGTVFPLSAVPQPWRDGLMLNPVAHGVEGVRAGLSAYYHHVPELSLGYLHAWALGLLFLGLALQRRFRHRMVSL